MAGDMAAALRNVSIHSNSVYLLARLIEEENALRVLGLELDSVNEVVALPTSKIQIARKIVASAYASPKMPRKGYRSLMGSLRCVCFSNTWWSQVAPMVDIQGLTSIWHHISTRTPLPTNTAEP
ncbi:hypothetical protein F441_05976 [Phytophthora nicotianae CJ01A1]|uniref:Uncharacterized protein n=2 Tax=Phytophthora nicotianae TaxID=4792 RepID=W2XBS1_PHYNI|nr:hypothetical protein F441_05976 [Phytophthora nicotianae CJ01A1]